jgi:hypothetical protein
MSQTEAHILFYFLFGFCAQFKLSRRLKKPSQGITLVGMQCGCSDWDLQNVNFTVGDVQAAFTQNSRSGFVTFRV